MIVNRNGEDPLGIFLANDIVVQVFFNLDRLEDNTLYRSGTVLSGHTLQDYLIAELNALVTDVDGGTGNQLGNILLTLAAKGTVTGCIISIAVLRCDASVSSS